MGENDTSNSSSLGKIQAEKRKIIVHFKNVTKIWMEIINISSQDQVFEHFFPFCKDLLRYLVLITNENATKWKKNLSEVPQHSSTEGSLILPQYSISFPYQSNVYFPVCLPSSLILLQGSSVNLEYFIIFFKILLRVLPTINTCFQVLYILSIFYFFFPRSTKVLINQDLRIQLGFFFPVKRS